MTSFDNDVIKNGLCVRILHETYKDLIGKGDNYIYSSEYKKVLNYLEKHKNKSISEHEYSVGYELLQELFTLSGMFCSDAEYIKMVISEYKEHTTYTLEDILDNYKFFLSCRKKGISAYYALNMLYFQKNDVINNVENKCE